MSIKSKINNISDFTKGILSGNRTILSRAITLGESDLDNHRKEFKKLMKNILPSTGKSIRIGITGIPGVGKSSFIDVLGIHLIEKFHKKVAVLTIDPSSQINKGSILGDKVRMEELSRSDKAYIRPSPSKTVLGGVAESTREALLLCEAAGYNVIFIETIGVGQSETEVDNLVDFLIMLQIAGAGDDLQIIKRGIFEKIDLLVLHKAEKENLGQIDKEFSNFKQIFSMLNSNESNWIPGVVKCSSHKKKGFDEISKIIFRYINQSKSSKLFEIKRKEQNKKWFDYLINTRIKKLILNDNKMLKEMKKYRNNLTEDSLETLKASDEVILILKKRFFS